MVGVSSIYEEITQHICSGMGEDGGSFQCRFPSCAKICHHAPRNATRIIEMFRTILLDVRSKEFLRQGYMAGHVAAIDAVLDQLPEMENR